MRAGQARAPRRPWGAARRRARRACRRPGRAGRSGRGAKGARVVRGAPRASTPSAVADGSAASRRRRTVGRRGRAPPARRGSASPASRQATWRGWCGHARRASLQRRRRSGRDADGPGAVPSRCGAATRRPGRARRRRRRACPRATLRRSGVQQGRRAPRCASAAPRPTAGWPAHACAPRRRRRSSPSAVVAGPRPTNGVAEHLDQALPGQRVGDDAPDPLAVGQPARRRAPGAAPTGCRRSRAGGRPPRRGRRPSLRSGRQRRAATSPSSVGSPSPGSSTVAADRRAGSTTYLARGVGEADEPGRAGRRRGRTGSRGLARVDVGDARRRRPAAELDEQVDGQLRPRPPRASGSTPRSKRLDASVGSLCRRDGAGHRDRVEVRGLDEHVGRGGVDLGRGAAHDPGDGQRRARRRR